MPLPPSEEFYRIKKLPPYVFAVINEMRDKARAAGIDIVDMGMGNPDGASPEPVVEKAIEAIRNPLNHRYSVSRALRRCGKRLWRATRSSTVSRWIQKRKRLRRLGLRMRSHICCSPLSGQGMLLCPRTRLIRFINTA